MFLVKKAFCKKKFCRTPRAAGPKSGPDRSVGASNPSKTIRRTQKPWKRGVFWPCNSLCSQNYAQNTFLGHFGRFGGPRALSRAPETQNSKIIHVMRDLGKNFFRLLNNPKRLGLRQKVPGKYPFGPNGVQFLVPKVHVFLSIYIYVYIHT